jgi:uncharacterized secreted protein with C-terminal beta-propeller domain
MSKKFDLIDFGEDKAKKIAEAMSNKNCKKILNHLEDKNASETDISNELKLPLSTVHYNVQKLLEVGLIKVKDFYWSPKGNKVYVYEKDDKTIVFTKKKSKHLENKLSMALSFIVFGCFIGLIIFLSLYPQDSSQVPKGYYKFQSNEEFINKLESIDLVVFTGVLESFSSIKTASIKSSLSSDSPIGETTYSDTNIQVKGVDEADIIKTDGEYIYAIAKENLVVIKAYPEQDAEILSKINVGDFSPMEMFIYKDKLLVFGHLRYNNSNVMSIRLYDTSDKKNLELLRVVDFEGNYITSRKIDSDVYFITESYPHIEPFCEDIVPFYRESKTDLKISVDELKPIVKCTDVGYIKSIDARNFITIASISMKDEDKKIEKEVILGYGRNVYASLNNIYIAQSIMPEHKVGELIGNTDKTIITKFKIDNGKIEFLKTGEVNGHILNQFSMDESNGYFRIATTSNHFRDSETRTSNNLYVLDEDLEVIGELEDLAPNENIYSVRFMGEKAYVVTFKKVDPLFVIDLSNPKNPKVLGKLKIPGYSDYLHPFDETHIIGIGKDTVEAENDLQQKRSIDFAWYQGVKIAVFDVSDVENPIEMHKIVIGDRGTNSEALNDHKAFLFDREKNLLIIPITLAEIKGEKTRDNQYGEFTFQGAYVYNLDLENGFNLKGRITHYDDNETFKKSGYYFRGDYSIKRSLYIENILYTLSSNRLQSNYLSDLSRIKELELN